MLKSVSDLSKRITVLRFPLLILIIGVHARFREDMLRGEQLPGGYIEFQDGVLQLFLIVAVAFFFLISGYLLSFKLHSGENPNRKFFAHKLKTILFPYLLWNTLLFFPHFLLPKILKNSALLPADKYAGSGGVTGILLDTYGVTSYYPIDVPLWYMRNLFCFTLLTWLWLFLLRKLGRWPGLLLVLVVTYLDILLIEGKLGIGFFLLGVWLGLYPANLEKFDRSRLFWFAGLVLLTAFASFWPKGAILNSATGFLYYGVTLIVFYTMGGLILRSPRLAAICTTLSAATFFLYCAHAPVATTLARIFLKLDLREPWQLAAGYGAIVAVTAVICCTAFFIGAKIAPRLMALLCGGRVHSNPASR